jgi:hypothetical protein
MKPRKIHQEMIVEAIRNYLGRGAWVMAQPWRQEAVHQDGSETL